MENIPQMTLLAWLVVGAIAGFAASCSADRSPW